MKDKDKIFFKKEGGISVCTLFGFLSFKCNKQINNMRIVKYILCLESY